MLVGSQFVPDGFVGCGDVEGELSVAVLSIDFMGPFAGLVKRVDFAEIAAREFGCKVLAITLSKEQANYARSRLANSGLSDQVEVRLQDYRDVQGSFDKIVSIEMFEAVGQEFWNDYFAVLKNLGILLKHQQWVGQVMLRDQQKVWN